MKRDAVRARTWAAAAGCSAKIVAASAINVRAFGSLRATIPLPSKWRASSGLGTTIARSAAWPSRFSQIGETCTPDSAASRRRLTVWSNTARASCARSSASGKATPSGS
ncbi:MAG: hypothetical protein IPM79_36055 [Polyangiaceae bacterium]|nr:hypothetical protein [Polyangiaceae bacterium]